jgi:hypothetical protein
MCRTYWFVKDDVPNCLWVAPGLLARLWKLSFVPRCVSGVKFAEVSRFVSVHDAALQCRSDE